MAKLQIVLICALAIVAFHTCLAEPQRAQRGAYYPSRYQRQRSRYLARQEADVAPPAPTPYPSADELKPAVPFDEAEAPIGAVPDEVYGPPDATNQPDEVYGPPELDGNGLSAAEQPAAAEPAAETFPAPLDDQQARLVAARRTAALRQRQQQVAAYRQAQAARGARPIKYRAVAQRRSA